MDLKRIAEIRERADIVDIIGKHVPLKRAGISMRGACPFHADLERSFHVHPVRQFYHCFACGASGDVFGFVRAYQKVSFEEAVAIVLDRI